MALEWRCGWRCYTGLIGSDVCIYGHRFNVIMTDPSILFEKKIWLPRKKNGFPILFCHRVIPSFQDSFHFSMHQSIMFDLIVNVPHDKYEL